MKMVSLTVTVEMPEKTLDAYALRFIGDAHSPAAGPRAETLARFFRNAVASPDYALGLKVDVVVPPDPDPDPEPGEDEKPKPKAKKPSASAGE